VTEWDNFTIASGVDPETGKGVCNLAWGPIRRLLDPAVVLITARDLQAAAVRAETDVALIHVLRDRMELDMSTTAAFLGDVRTQRPMLPGKSALRIEAVAGYHTGLPQVQHRSRLDEGGTDPRRGAHDGAALDRDGARGTDRRAPALRPG
jgi:hypothetical protein